MLFAACLWLALMGLFYARDSFTLAFCVVMAAAFGLGARLLPLALVGGVNLFIASFTALYAAMDLKDDLWNGAVRAQSDAQLLANLTVVPAIVWAAVWTVVSLGILATGLVIALREGRSVTLDLVADLGQHPVQRIEERANVASRQVAPPARTDEQGVTRRQQAAAPEALRTGRMPRRVQAGHLERPDPHHLAGLDLAHRRPEAGERVRREGQLPALRVHRHVEELEQRGHRVEVIVVVVGEEDGGEAATGGHAGLGDGAGVPRGVDDRDLEASGWPQQGHEVLHRAKRQLAHERRL
jgi:hypothetical protein